MSFQVRLKYKKANVSIIIVLELIYSSEINTYYNFTSHTKKLLV